MRPNSSGKGMGCYIGGPRFNPHWGGTTRISSLLTMLAN